MRVLSLAFLDEGFVLQDEKAGLAVKKAFLNAETAYAEIGKVLGVKAVAESVNETVTVETETG